MAAEPLTELVVRLDPEQMTVFTEMAKTIQMTVEELVQWTIDSAIAAYVASVTRPELAQELFATEIGQNTMKRFRKR